MFYSQCLLSKKGTLKSIWVAAYFHKKLKKQQVADTHIPSSVDMIILNEVSVTYRVLGYLLLGVVRIFSKKVEYLYHDCSEVLTKIKTYTPLHKPKEGMCASYASITIPERFELDGFDLELPDDMNGGSVLPNQKITLEERLEDAGNEQYFMNKYFHEEEFARFEIRDVVHTPVRDALSPQSMEKYTEIFQSQIVTNSEASLEKLQGHPKEFPDIETNCEAEEPMDRFPDVGLNGEDEESMDLEPQFNKVDGQAKQIRNLEITPLDPEKSGIPTEGGLAAITTDGTPHGSSFPYDSGAATPEFVVIQTPAKKEQPRFSRKRKHLIDNMMVLANEVIRKSLEDSSSLVVKRRKVPATALDVWNAQIFTNQYQNFLEPLIPCTPQLKTLFHRRIGAPEPLEASEGAVKLGEERCVPQRECSEDRTCSQENVINHSSRRSVEIPPEPLQASEGPVLLGEDRCEPNRECSEDRACSQQNVIDHSRRPAEIPETSKSDRIVPMTLLSGGEDGLLETETQSSGLNLMDEELGPQEDNNSNNQSKKAQSLYSFLIFLSADGWTVRTRMVASFLCKRFLKEPGKAEVLNLNLILEGKTRKENARLFYEILVLKSEGLVDVKQDTPYGDICVLNTPQMATV
ncbi:hypothetical protein IFM89_017371 [Coptis chinensis]|uniref:Sister chromatid cohesion 1 protein 2 n=1 Tax=Coptis chinensis TaxID=261450 RepID=A0A835HK96_9MAGN|nr:hypothetical protein IFM89_017371 [Coptis chinensis]